ncbi:hypothetical protein BU16DRAFT_449626 [Lophium mytilinum]|uniref:PXA domain-containing protein n=1 Tax=Lophium mytilinum TaxID=390894 RepID=A0A6A6RG16_9PEZI|nr:hypothetical protein BU16DRAFT_449626 [Lophium mytilinum]
MTQTASRETNLPQTQPPTSKATSTVPAAAGGNLSNPLRATGTRSTETPKHAPDTTSDKATAAFIRRTLCAHNVLLGNGEKGRNTPLPIDELLPPLTSSNDVDLQLYAIIAVIIKEFVYTWYSKITPDQVFVNEVIQVIAHCTRALEQRLRKVDLEALLLDEIPELLEAHVNAYRISHQSLHHNPLVSHPRTIYHTLHPHPALSPVPLESDPASVAAQQQNEAAWRQLVVQGVLAVLLPTEDLENGCLRLLVAEIFAEMIVGNGISEKACEGWLLWEGVTRIAEVLQAGADADDRSSKEMKPEQTMSRLERYGLLSSSLEEAAEPVKGHKTPSPRRASSHGGASTSVARAFWLAVQYAFLACNALRAVIVALATCSSLPPRSVAGVSAPASTSEHRRLLPQPAEGAAEGGHGAGKRAMVSMNVWSCTARLLSLERRMPWLAGVVALLHWMVVRGPGRVGDTDGVLDR